MKKITACIITAVLLLTLGGLTVFAAGRDNTKSNGSGTGLYNNSNLCDNYEVKSNLYQETVKNTSCNNYTDADGDGICDNCTNPAGSAHKCTGYTDADGDGICDNCTNPAGSAHKCTGYTDADGDGICDNCNVLSTSDHRCSNFTDADGDGICDHCTGNQNRYGAANNYCQGTHHGTGTTHVGHRYGHHAE